VKFILVSSQPKFFMQSSKIPSFRLKVGSAIAGLLLTFTLTSLQAFAAEASGTNVPAPGGFSETATEWIDAVTGHRVIRLSTEPGSLSLYFHQNAYTPQGDKMIIYTPEGLAAVNLKTRAIELVAPGVRYGPGTSATIEVGRKTRTVYYQKDEGGQTIIYATDVDTKATRVIAKLGFTGQFGGVTADETLIIGKHSVRAAGQPAQSPSSVSTNAPGQGRRGGRGGGAGGMLEFFAVDIKSGAVRTFLPMTDNLNHDQCSPTDSSLILYCHEGTWDLVDRIWTIRTDGTGNRLMHPRTMPMEIAGHEFFGYDGETVWYDLQTPKSGVFWLAGVNVQTGERIRYPIERSQWSVHYNQSHDGKLFAGDGGGPNGVSNRTPDGQTFNPPANGQWLYLFTPRPDKLDMLKVGNDDVKIGKFDVEKLLDLSKHNYTLEPNLTFTPDNKWIVFRSNIQGGSQVYAVEIAK
jgi:oligogalacturonide lyase